MPLLGAARAVRLRPRFVCLESSSHLLHTSSRVLAGIAIGGQKGRTRNPSSSSPSPSSSRPSEQSDVAKRIRSNAPLFARLRGQDGSELLDLHAPSSQEDLRRSPSPSPPTLTSRMREGEADRQSIRVRQSPSPSLSQTPRTQSNAADSSSMPPSQRAPTFAETGVEQSAWSTSRPSTTAEVRMNAVTRDAQYLKSDERIQRSAHSAPSEKSRPSTSAQARMNAIAHGRQSAATHEHTQSHSQQASHPERQPSVSDQKLTNTTVHATDRAPRQGYPLPGETRPSTSAEARMEVIARSKGNQRPASYDDRSFAQTQTAAVRADEPFKAASSFDNDSKHGNFGQIDANDKRDTRPSSMQQPRADRQRRGTSYASSALREETELKGENAKRAGQSARSDSRSSADARMADWRAKDEPRAARAYSFRSATDAQLFAISALIRLSSTADWEGALIFQGEREKGRLSSSVSVTFKRKSVRVLSEQEDDSINGIHHLAVAQGGKIISQSGRKKNLASNGSLLPHRQAQREMANAEEEEEEQRRKTLSTSPPNSARMHTSLSRTDSASGDSASLDRTTGHASEGPDGRVMGTAQDDKQSSIEKNVPIPNLSTANDIAKTNTNASVDSVTGLASQGPVSNVLGTAQERYGSPIEENVPVPNLEHEHASAHQQALHSAAAGNSRIDPSRAGREKGAGAVWIQMQDGEDNSVSREIDDEAPLRIDESVPVEVSSTQLGKGKGGNEE